MARCKALTSSNMRSAATGSPLLLMMAARIDKTLLCKCGSCPAILWWTRSMISFAESKSSPPRQQIAQRDACFCNPRDCAKGFEQVDRMAIAGNSLIRPSQAAQGACSDRSNCAARRLVCCSQSERARSRCSSASSCADPARACSAASSRYVVLSDSPGLQPDTDDAQAKTPAPPDVGNRPSRCRPLPAHGAAAGAAATATPPAFVAPVHAQSDIGCRDVPARAAPGARVPLLQSRREPHPAACFPALRAAAG